MVCCNCSTSTPAEPPRPATFLADASILMFCAIMPISGLCRVGLQKLRKQAEKSDSSPLRRGIVFGVVFGREPWAAKTGRLLCPKPNFSVWPLFEAVLCVVGSELEQVGLSAFPLGGSIGNQENYADPPQPKSARLPSKSSKSMSLVGIIRRSA